MASVDSTSFDAALKEYYTKEAVKDLTYEDNPWHAMIPKKKVGGRRYIQPVQYGIPSGRSRTFSKAQANKGTNKYEDFVVTYADDYAALSITRKVMKQSDSEASFFEAQEREISSMLKKLTRSCAISEYRGTGGAKGQISSGYSSSTTFTLADPEEISNFELDDRLVFSANNGDTSSDTLVSATPTTITAIDRDAGTITVDSDTNLAASRYVFIEGDFQNSIAGLLAWIPTTAPTGSDSFFGVNRSVDATRLAGSRISATSVPIAEAVRQGTARLGREGAAPDTALMSHAKYRDLVLELGSKVEYEMTKPGDANVGFTGVKFIGGKRPITCHADQNCPDDNIFLLTKDTWKFVSLGEVPEMVDEDGSTMLREVSASGFEVRAEYYGNMVCDDPRANCVLTVA